MGLAFLQQRWIEQFTHWAQSRKDIRTVLLTGSCSRTDQDLATEWPDLDILFLTTKPERYTKSNSWMQECLALYGQGSCLPAKLLAVSCPSSAGLAPMIWDWLLSISSYPIRAHWAVNIIRLLYCYPALRRRLPESVSTLGTEMGDLLRQGARRLVDKDRFGEKFQQATVAVAGMPNEKPSRDQFRNSVADFWFGPPKAVTDLARAR